MWTVGSKNVREMNGRELVLSDFGVEDMERKGERETSRK